MPAFKKDPFWKLTSCDFFLGISLGVTQGKLYRLGLQAQPPVINHKIPPILFCFSLFNLPLPLSCLPLLVSTLCPERKQIPSHPLFSPSHPCFSFQSVCLPCTDSSLWRFIFPLWRQTGTLKANWHFAFTFPFPFGTNPNPLQRLHPKPIMTPKLTPKPPLEKLKAKWHFSISNFLTFVKTILFLLFSHVLSFIFLCVFLLFLLIRKTSLENFQVPKGKKRCPFSNHSQMLF